MRVRSGSVSGGIIFCGLLSIAFIVLKLVGVIDWSWVWVTCPLWISSAILVGSFLIFCVVELIRFLWKRRHCIWNGHTFVPDSEFRKWTYGSGGRYVPVYKCKKCGHTVPRDN